MIKRTVSRSEFSRLVADSEKRERYPDYGPEKAAGQDRNRYGERPEKGKR